MEKNRPAKTSAETIAEIDALITGRTGRDRTVSPDAMRAAPNGPTDLGTDPDTDLDPDLGTDRVDITDVFGDPIDLYTRADAIADGTLFEVPEDIRRHAGIAVPTALTRAAWEGCVAWTAEDAARTGAIQDQDGRLVDVVWMGMQAARRARPTDDTPIPFTVCRVARDAVPGEDGVEPTEVRLWIVLGADQDGAPCVTIMQPGER
ncbi:DUF6573 family protein [Actinomadura violacea]|uniref:Uncharacterized protein n=1 Tax=Actinomadura violacea TaxID=2819934 RepID=A0ABS3S7L0_9ACTN|nr:DUF6573 family protein [Actinomadura violacea]MBO2464987.1 hypothetical protein [Actinomadura violacea]